ncbi:MAG: chromate transporter [Clostridia bacterium]|nr:chromate transporter [Clostridia bacterium]
MKSTSLWQLFWTFFKIGAFTFGGGWSLIAVMEEEVVVRRKWATPDDMLEMLIISESTPGVIAVNMATSIGYRQRGFWGALVATMGVVVPSFVIISALSFGLEALAQNKWYQAVFYGIQVGAIVLILNAFLKLFKQLEKNASNLIVMVVALSVSLFTNVNVVFVIIAGAVFGILVNCVFNKNKRLPAEAVGEATKKEDE